MKRTQVHRRLHALGEATTAQLSKDLGIRHSTVKSAMRVLCANGDAVVVRERRGRTPAIYASAQAPQSDAPGLSEQLRAVLYGFHTLSSQLAAIAGVAASGVHQAIDAATFDTPDSGHQVLTRPVAAESVDRLADRLEARAVELRAWVGLARAAERGDS